MPDDRDRPMTPPPAEAPEKVKAAREFCEGLLARLGAQVEVKSAETP
ncbi:MAG TPA: hypothetical protein VF400_04575 [Anaeromyxobacteraceae bacterium]